MRELTISEIDFIAGGITENQCIGAFMVGGGILGAIGGSFAAGVGAIGGAGFGMGAGGAAGMLFCEYMVN